jgi:hypothetical protein
MKGEILSLDSAQKVSSYTRLERDRNFYKLENKRLEKEIALIKQENEYLKKRDKTLTALENSLAPRIAAYEEKNAPAPVIQELEYIKNMLMLEKEKLLEKEEIQDEE